MNDTKTKLLINVGTDQELATRVFDLLEATGYKVGVVSARKGVADYIARGVPASIVIESRSTVGYSDTAWFDRQKSDSQYCNLPTLDLAKIIPPIRVGDHTVVPTDNGVQVGCTFVPWETVEKIAALQPKK